MHIPMISAMLLFDAIF